MFITFVDIDDTLFLTDCKIYVKQGKEIIKKISSNEFNNYVLNGKEYFDFSEFTNADKLISTARPNWIMIKKIKKLIRTDKIYLLTARPDMDDKESLIKFFNHYGIPVGHEKDDKIHIIRCGNIDFFGKTKTIQQKKTYAIDQILERHKFYQSVKIYDDYINNLQEFLKQDYINSEAYLVSNNRIEKFNVHND